MTTPTTDRITDLRTMPYKEYLQTPEWKERRQAAIERAGGRCQLCNSQGPFQVHHRTYDNRGCELPGDLTVLCKECHVKYHDKQELTNEEGIRADNNRLVGMFLDTIQILYDHLVESLDYSEYPDHEMEAKASPRWAADRSAWGWICRLSQHAEMDAATEEMERVAEGEGHG